MNFRNENITQTTNNKNITQTTNNENIQKTSKRNIPILEDSLFKNITIYLNDDLWENSDGSSGIEKCLFQCDGKCVEYGYSGDALCFPKIKN